MTLMFSNILVPHDGTEISDAALTKAYQIAKVFGSNLTLLFVIEDRSVLLDQLNPFVKEETQIERTENQMVNILRKGTEAMLKDKIVKAKITDIKVITEVAVDSSASRRILEFAKEKKVDIIIMGARKLEGFERLKALGSVARKVSERAKCPVMLIH